MTSRTNWRTRRGAGYTVIIAEWRHKDDAMCTSQLIEDCDPLPLKSRLRAVVCNLTNTRKYIDNHNSKAVK